MPRWWKARGASVEDAPNSFASYLRDYMLSHRPNLTVAELARQLGVQRATIYRYLHGERLPDIHDLPRYAEAMRRPVVELYAACGLAVPPPQPMAPPARITAEARAAIQSEVWDGLLRSIAEDPTLSPGQRAALLRIAEARRAGELSPVERARAQEWANPAPTPAEDEEAPVAPISAILPKQTDH